MRFMPTICHHASFIDTLFNKFSGFQSVGSLRLAISVNPIDIIQWQQVATSSIQSRPVATGVS
jgi:hypothetical protein